MQSCSIPEIFDLASTEFDAGVVRPTLAECLSKINAANLKKAHVLIESERTRGK